MPGVFGRFRPDRSASTPGPEIPPISTTATPPQTFVFRAFADPTPPPPPVGSFEYDLASSKYQQRWDSFKNFELWLQEEQRSKAIELRLVNTYRDSPLYERTLRYACSRGGTGGTKPYSKLHPTWNRKTEGKRTGCQCSLLVKQYPGTSTVLGNYSDTHNHDVGTANLRFTQISKETREYIAGLLRLKVSPDHILKLLHQGVYGSDDVFEGDLDGDFVANRAEFIQLRDIRRIEKDIQAEDVRLHPDDGLSTLRWVENLRAQGHLLGFKSKTDPPPPGSNLDPEVFTLMIQTGWQRNVFQKYGTTMLYVDATHNTTMYEHLNLTTLIVRDKWAHGVPVAWMLASNGTQSTISHFLRLHRAASPQTIPRHIMSDFDWPQINAAVEVYHEAAAYYANLRAAFILLCWWHVLHAWQKHFSITQNPELWDLLKQWIRITDEAKFQTAWIEIQRLAGPDSTFIAYLKEYWMKDRVVRMWSGVYRKDRSIFSLSDTNMLVEAWHHVLKGKFLLGKRNRRLDHLLYTLMKEVLPYFALKQRRQDIGFEGVDIEVRKRQDIVKRSQVYTKEDIIHVQDQKYLVPSKSDSSRAYEVDVDTYTCTCLDYPLICYCKHICAVQRLFDVEEQEAGASENVPTSPAVPALSSLPASTSAPAPLVQDVAPKPVALVAIAEKLERLAARLRRPNKIKNDDPCLADLEDSLQTMLLATDGIAVLPPAQRFAPVVKNPTARETMLPKVKTRHVRAGDPAYGGGASSGSLAIKKGSKKAKLTKTPTTSVLPQPPVHHAPPQQAYAPQQPHFYPFYYPPPGPHYYQAQPATSGPSAAVHPYFYPPPHFIAPGPN